MADDSENEEKQVQFHQMELDDRILKAIALLGWLTPTLIQEKAIPLLLEGKDVLVRAKTGSGKINDVIVVSSKLHRLTEIFQFARQNCCICSSSGSENFKNEKRGNNYRAIHHNVSFGTKQGIVSTNQIVI